MILDVITSIRVVGPASFAPCLSWDDAWEEGWASKVGLQVAHGGLVDKGSVQCAPLHGSWNASLLFQRLWSPPTARPRALPACFLGPAASKLLGSWHLPAWKGDEHLAGTGPWWL